MEYFKLTVAVSYRYRLIVRPCGGTREQVKICPLAHLPDRALDTVVGFRTGKVHEKANFASVVPFASHGWAAPERTSETSIFMTTLLVNLFLLSIQIFNVFWKPLVFHTNRFSYLGLANNSRHNQANRPPVLGHGSSLRKIPPFRVRGYAVACGANRYTPHGVGDFRPASLEPYLVPVYPVKTEPQDFKIKAEAYLDLPLIIFAKHYILLFWLVACHHPVCVQYWLNCLLLCGIDVPPSQGPSRGTPWKVEENMMFVKATAVICCRTSKRHLGRWARHGREQSCPAGTIYEPAVQLGGMVHPGRVGSNDLVTVLVVFTDRTPWRQCQMHKESRVFFETCDGFCCSMSLVSHWASARCLALGGLHPIRAQRGGETDNDLGRFLHVALRRTVQTEISSSQGGCGTDTTATGNGVVVSRAVFAPWPQHGSPVSVSLFECVWCAYVPALCMTSHDLKLYLETGNHLASLAPACISIFSHLSAVSRPLVRSPKPPVIECAIGNQCDLPRPSD
ncbi:uncharacterized protein BDR25DRAFT_390305, partial [Lindgomyces ingoldianus]